MNSIQFVGHRENGELPTQQQSSDAPVNTCKNDDAAEALLQRLRNGISNLSPSEEETHPVSRELPPQRCQRRPKPADKYLQNV